MDALFRGLFLVEITRINLIRASFQHCTTQPRNCIDNRKWGII